MKTFKSLFILLLLSVSMAATAQTTMKEAFKAYIKTNPSFTNMSPETMGNALEAMNLGLMKNYEEAKSKELVNKYLEESFMDDLVDAMLPFMEEYVSVDEIKELTDIFSSGQGKTFQEHWGKINGTGSKFEQLGIEIAQKVMSGEEPTPVQAVTCPESYKNLFQQFYKESGQEGLLTSAFNGLTESFSDDQKSMMEKIKGYLSSNLCTVLLNESYGILTEEDMKFGLELGKKQAWQDVMKGAASLMSHSQEMGMNVVMNYVTWLQDQGVDTNM
ncbi:MAG: hypothetical protein J5548_14115 [Prevotella sp.]|nr:hypothetical protein [Prevotella sp.]